MAHYWATHTPLQWWVFLLPCLVNGGIAIAGWQLAVARSKLTLAAFLVVGPCLMAYSIYFVLKVYVIATSLESTLFDDLARTFYAVAGLVLFFGSFRLLEMIFKGDDHDDWNDDDPEPDEPTPPGPSPGLVQQTSSSRLSWSVSYFPSRVEM